METGFKKILLFIKRINLSIFAWVFYFTVHAQCLPIHTIIDSSVNTRKSSLLNDIQKLKIFYNLKKTIESCKIPKDSVYAGILNEIAVIEFTENNDYNKAISYTLDALKINTSSDAGSSLHYAIDNYSFLGDYYRELMLYQKAISNYDSAIYLAEKITPGAELILYCKLYKANSLFRFGDFQKCIEESFNGSISALKMKKEVYYTEFLNQKAQSEYYQNNLPSALSDIELIIKTATSSNDRYQLASALKTKAKIFQKKGDFSKADLLFRQCISIRTLIGANNQIANDYADWGDFYMNSLGNYNEAKKCFYKTIEYTAKDKNNSKLALPYVSLGEICFNKHEYKDAEKYYLKALKELNAANTKNILENQPASFFNLIGNKNLVTDLLVNKAKLLLQFFKLSKDRKYLTAYLQTAMVTDSVITQTRHEQLGEQSKLYWRDNTRDFFTEVMEACYLSGDTKSAFYFLEKSRSVLLNDKLNELGASEKLPDSMLLKERILKIEIITEQQKLADLNSNTEEYNKQYSNVITARTKLDNFTKSLETKYPAYYQYKYADEVPKLDSLKKYLSLNHQSFVHYFTNDTVAYILSITAGNTRIFKLDKNNFHREEINGFINFCSNKDSLNYYYTSFKALSNSIYKTLFQPLNLPKGRVIICSDNFLLPFEALYTDPKNGHFLIQDYTFSYAYSATYLLKRFTDFPAKGNFIGFAPVSFQKYLDVPDLKNSATALANSADYYNNNLLLIKNDATKNNFIQKIAGYTIVNVFSHASADSSDKEPKLYMQDSTINLSELQLLNTKPATKLVVLSACQTNVGKNATGEGIYSLARGFTAAGIPSIAATLWNADEDMIYEISANFHKYLSQRMSKDSALQKAKIDFIKNNNSEKALPYYWANMVLIGNTEPLKLLPDQNTQWLWIAIVSGTVLAFATFILLKRKRHNTQ